VPLSDGSTTEVSTLTIGGSNLYGFAGVNGPYRQDSNGDGTIDGSDSPNPDAVGLSLEGMTGGLALMKETLPGLNNYYGLHAEANTLQMVGIDGLTASADNIKIEVNDVKDPLNPVSTTVVDFSSLEGGKLSVPTGGAPVDLDFDRRLVRASGELDVNLFDLVSLDGVFDFELSTERLLAYEDATARVGPEGFSMELDSTGLMVVDENGVALDLDLSGDAELASVLDVDVGFGLTMNTSGQAYTYEVPEEFLDDVDYTSLTIPAGAPQPDGTEGAPGFYVVLDGDGTIGLLDTVDLVGSFYVQVSTEELRLMADATMSAPLLPNLAAAGELRINGDGVLGNLQIGGSSAVDLFGVDAFSMNGQFQLEVNTMDTAQTIRRLNIADDGSVNGLVDGTIGANTLRVAGGANMTLGGVFEIGGAVEMVFSDQGFDVSLDAGLDLGGFGAVEVVGAASILNTASGPVFAANVGLDVEIGIPMVNIRGAGTLQINTSSTTTYAGVAPSTFVVNVDGTVQVLLFEMDAQVTIAAQNDVFRIGLDNLSLDFFGFINVTVNGFVESDGDFAINGETSVGIDLGPLDISGGLAVNLSNTSFGGRLWGEVSVGIDFPWPIGWIGVTLAGIEGAIELGAASAYVGITVTALGIDFGGSMSWSWGAPPDIARQVGDTVYLNMGTDGHLRGSLYEDLTAESYTITGSGGNITVESLGQTETFSGVNKIVVNDGGEGNDFVYIGPGITADVQIAGGGDNDTIVYAGNGTAIIDGGAGNDVVMGGPGDDELTGGAGTDEVNGAEGNDNITVSGGNDTVGSGPGNDSILIQAGQSTVSTEAGADTIVIEGGTSTVDGGDGDDVLKLNYPVALGQTTFKGQGGDDLVQVAMNSDSGALTFDDHAFAFGDHEVVFNDSLESFQVTDSGTKTTIGSTADAGGQLGATGLTLIANAVELNRDLSARELSVQAQNGVALKDMLTVTEHMDVAAASVSSTAGASIQAGSSGWDITGSVSLQDSVDVTGLMDVSANTFASDGTIDAGSMTFDVDDTVDFHSSVTVGSAMSVTSTTLTADQSVQAGSATWSVTTDVWTKDAVTVNGLMDVDANRFMSDGNVHAGSMDFNVGQDVAFHAPVLVDSSMAVTSNALTSDRSVQADSATWSVTTDVWTKDTVTVSGLMDVNANRFTSDANVHAGSMDFDAGQDVTFHAPVLVDSSMSVTANTLTADQTVQADSSTWNVTTDVWTKDTVDVTKVMRISADSVLADREVTAGGLVWNVGHDVELNAHPTVTGTMGGGNIGLLKIISEQGQIDFAGQDFHAADGHLVLSAQQGFTDTIRSEARALTAINRGTGGREDIIVREADDLVVLDHGLPSGGVYSQHGVIDVELAAQDALLTLSSGIISTDISAQNIRLAADDMDFTSGENRISGLGELTIHSTHDAINYRVGSGAEASSGDDRTDEGDDGHMDLSMRDMAAIADDFSLVIIGHEHDGNTMRFGDVEDATEIKYTGEPRVVNAAQQNHTQFFAETMSIEGDIRAPADRTEFYADRVEVNSQNLHDPMGVPDSGVTAREVYFDVDEQMVVSGWIMGDDLVHLNVHSTAGNSPLIVYDDGPNSLKTDVGSIIRGGKNNSLVDIDASGSVKVAGIVKTGAGTPGEPGATGQAARIDIDSASSVIVLEGGLVYGRHPNTRIEMDATTFLHVEPGSAVTAGADFDYSSGAPVAFITGNDADIHLGCSNEMWIGGAVTASRNMDLAMGGTFHDFADYFDTIPGRDLFSTDAAADVVTQLDAQGIAPDLVQAFSENNHALAGATTVEVIEAGSRWRVIDSEGNRYILHVDDNDPSVLDVMEPHYLDGHRGFSFLLTGTLTTLMTEADLGVAAGDDVIVRGNINVLGQDSDLTLQSDKWVYWEGFADVSGDIAIYGGLETSGTDRGGANAHGSSVYVHATSRLTTAQAGTAINVYGSKDIDLFGAIVPGGSVGESGVTFAGPNSTAHIEAGEQIYLDTGIVAAKTVELVAGEAGADDDRVSVLVNTAGGLTAAGWTSDGSGGLVSVQAGTDVWMMGHVTAGATVSQEFDEDGDLVGETYNWSNEPGTIRIEATGQALIGGMTTNKAGETVETGGYLSARDSIDVTGGANPDGRGVYVPGAAELVVHKADGSIVLDAAQDTHILGLLVAGGQVDNYYDADGQYLGRKLHQFSGDSTITIQADNQIRVGQDIQAGKTINLIGGQDETGKGTVIQGSVHVSTWQPNSTINLDAPGDIDILAPAATNEIEADGFIERADGRLAHDVTLDVWLDKVDFEVQTQVTVTAADAADNTGIADLMEDLQTALNTAEFTVTQSDNAEHPVGSTYTFDDPDDNPDIEVKLRNSRFLLAGPYSFKIGTGSVNADLLGLDLSDGVLVSSLPYTLLAPEAGSVINIGAPAGPNGKLYIAGKVKAHSAINLNSAQNDGGQDVDLDWTGLLETVAGSITLSPGGQDAVIKGDVIAGGQGSDVVVTAAHTLTVHGSFQAQDDIIITAGSEVVPGEVSLQTTGTSELRTQGQDSQILITGVNDVSINSHVGGLNPELELIRIGSTHGSLAIEHESGWIETGAQIRLVGHDVDMAGVLRSHKATVAARDNEVVIDIDGTAEIHGDVELAGSMLVSADEKVLVHGTTLAADAAGQRLTLQSDGDVQLGTREANGDGTFTQHGGVVQANRLLEIKAGNLVQVNSGVKVMGTADSSKVSITAPNVDVIGSIFGGADVDGDDNLTWTGQNAVVDVEADGTLTLGGVGVDDDGSLVTRGGTIRATGMVDLDLGGAATGVAFSANSLSSITGEATGDGTWTAPVTPSLLRINTDQDIQISGTLQTLDAGSDITLNSATQILVDGYLQAADTLTVTGGSDASGAGIVVQPLIFQTDGQGNLVDENGRLIDDDGYLINADGEYVDADGNVLPDGADPVTGGQPVRLSGGTLTTALGGSIELRATDDIVVHGVLGDVTESGGGITAEAANIQAESTAGAVSVTGRVEFQGTLTFTAPAINVLPGGQIKARGDDAVLLLDADTVYLAASAGGTASGLVQGTDLAHLLGTTVQVDGRVRTSGGDSRVLLNGEDDVIVTGQVQSAHDIEINAGINRAWSLNTLTSRTLSKSDLGQGDLTIQGAGGLDAATDVRIRVGGDVNVLAGAMLGDGTKTVTRPILSTGPQTIQVVTGYQQVADGFIQVPEVHWVATEVTEQVGMEEVKIGSEFYTMDVTLEQIGYYNPHASAGAKTRQFFIEGIDYFNSTFGWTTDYKSDSYKTFTQLSDAQRTQVLDHLGYMPLYDFTFANPQVHRTVNGNPTSSAWTPSWYEANDLYANNNVTDGLPETGDSDDVIYYIGVSGWDNKYIRMPAGAQEDVLRVVSQGEPQLIGDTTAVVNGETITVKKVGEYNDRASARYTQQNTDYGTQTLYLYEPWYSTSTTMGTMAVGSDNYWTTRSDYRRAGAYNEYFRTSYNAATGDRYYEVYDGRTGANQVHRDFDPLWSWSSSPTYTNYPPGGSNPSGRYIQAPSGFYSTTLSSSYASQVSSWPVGTGTYDYSGYVQRSYLATASGDTWINHYNNYHSSSGHLATFRNSQEMQHAVDVTYSSHNDPNGYYWIGLVATGGAYANQIGLTAANGYSGWYWLGDSGTRSGATYFPSSPKGTGWWGPGEPLGDGAEGRYEYGWDDNNAKRQSAWQIRADIRGTDSLTARQQMRLAITIDADVTCRAHA